MDASGNGRYDINDQTTAFTIRANGSVEVTVGADVGSSDYPWSYQVMGNLVPSGPFQGVAGSYSGTVSGQAVQAIVAPDGTVYFSSPNHGGAAMGNVLAYRQPATLASLGHQVETFTLSTDASISATTTNLSTGSSLSFTMSRVAAAAVAPSPPLISGVDFSGGTLTLQGTNGALGGTYYVLWSTNLSVPLSQWPRLATNVPGWQWEFYHYRSQCGQSSYPNGLLHLPNAMNIVSGPTRLK